MREERIKNGFTQEKLASMAEMHRTYIGMVERGEKNVTVASIKKIADALKINVKDLLS